MDGGAAAGMAEGAPVATGSVSGPLHRLAAIGDTRLFLGGLAASIVLSEIVAAVASLLLTGRVPPFAWVVAFLTPLTVGSLVLLGFLGIIRALRREVTERRSAEDALRESEARFRSLVEVAPDGIAVHCEGRMVFINEAGRRLMGAHSAEQLIGRPSIEFVHPDSRQMVAQRIKDVLAGKGPLELIEEKYLRLDGRTVEVEVAATPTTWRGRPAGQVVIRDIGERKRMLRELDQRTRDLERSNGELELIAYAASHDLQEPLRSVTSFVQLLQRRYAGKLDQSADEYIRFAVDGAQRMQVIINDLLSFSRLGKDEARRTPVPMGEVVAAALADLHQAVEESGAVVEAADDLPTVQGDRSQLVQMVANLLSNAIKYRGEASPRITVTAARVAGEWAFAVRDNGIGIAAEYHGQVFAPFQRLHTRDAYPGTGIGLAICEKIVAGHGGRIWVESAPGDGSAFLFTLPAGSG